jgi:energy-coupling factor transporter transmembrane protein EcfT
MLFPFAELPSLIISLLALLFPALFCHFILYAIDTFHFLPFYIMPASPSLGSRSCSFHLWVILDICDWPLGTSFQKVICHWPWINFSSFLPHTLVVTSLHFPHSHLSSFCPAHICHCFALFTYVIILPCSCLSWCCPTHVCHQFALLILSLFWHAHFVIVLPHSCLSLFCPTQICCCFGLSDAESSDPFNIDPQDLHHRILQTQHICHPDTWKQRGEVEYLFHMSQPIFFSCFSQTEFALATAQSSQLNKAYQTLLSPLNRVQYILSLQGVEEIESEKFEDQDLIMQVMEAH